MVRPRVFCYRNTKLSPAPCLLSAMAAGRIVYGLLGAFILPMFGFEKIAVIYPITYGVLGEPAGDPHPAGGHSPIGLWSGKTRLPIYVREGR